MTAILVHFVQILEGLQYYSMVTQITKFIDTKHDPNGNFILLRHTIENNKFTLVCIYGPNSDDPLFYHKISEAIEEMENASCVICGDFNLVLDPNIDYHNYKSINNKKAREKLN